MDNEQLLLQIGSMLEQQTKTMMGEINKVKTELTGEISKVKTDLTSEIADVRTDLMGEMKNSEMRVKIFVENEIMGQIKSLFDGFQIAIENQLKLDKRVCVIENRLGVVV